MNSTHRSPDGLIFLSIGGLSAQYHTPKFVHVIPLHFSVSFTVTVPAQQLEIVPRKAHGRVADVLRRQLPLVVHDFTRRAQSALHTPFTQTAHARSVCIPRVLPRFRLVECFCKIFHISKTWPAPSHGQKNVQVCELLRDGAGVIQVARMRASLARKSTGPVESGSVL